MVRVWTCAAAAEDVYEMPAPDKPLSFIYEYVSSNTTTDSLLLSQIKCSLKCSLSPLCVYVWVGAWVCVSLTSDFWLLTGCDAATRSTRTRGPTARRRDISIW